MNIYIFLQEEVSIFVKSSILWGRYGLQQGNHLQYFKIHSQIYIYFVNILILLNSSSIDTNHGVASNNLNFTLILNYKKMNQHLYHSEVMLSPHIKISVKFTIRWHNSFKEATQTEEAKIISNKELFPKIMNSLNTLK